MVGWAIKQLAIWLIGGFVVYSLVVNYQLFGLSTPAVRPESAVAPVDGTPADASHEELRPLGQAAPAVVNSLNLRANPDGYAYVDAAVNGADMRMAFDTGASVVSLTQADAIKAGVAGNLNYSLVFRTANGSTRGAPVMLREDADRPACDRGCESGRYAKHANFAARPDLPQPAPQLCNTEWGAHADLGVVKPARLTPSAIRSIAWRRSTRWSATSRRPTSRSWVVAFTKIVGLGHLAFAFARRQHAAIDLRRILNAQLLLCGRTKSG